MTMLRFDPFRGFETVLKKINEVATDLEQGVIIEKAGKFSPRVDIYDDEQKIYIFAEIAGINKDDVSIKLNEDRLLTVSGLKKREEETRTFIRNERNFGEFTRSFVLPENIDTEKIQANYRNGVLEIAIDKKQPEAPKEIIVNID